MSTPRRSPLGRSRLATLADVAALTSLVNSAYRGARSRDGWTTEADLLGGQRTDVAALHEFIGSAPSTQAMLMIDDENGQPLACVQLERRTSDTAYLGMLTVRPDRQTGGLGKALLAEAEAYVRDAWASRCLLMTVIAQRQELIGWYERHGYARTGETAAFPYGNPRFGEPLREDLHFVLLAKTLDENV
jgi:ribosomal protein S18 acetylase RimI-like enzyme